MSIQRISQATLRSASGFLFALILATCAMAPGQTLRLDDLFTSSTATTPEAPSSADAPPPKQTISLEEIDPSQTSAYLDQAEIQINEERYAEALRLTSLLSAWVKKDSADYGRVLYYRGRAYAGLGEEEKLTTIAIEYLDRFKTDGVHRGWFLMELARQKEAGGAQRDSAVFWRAILKEKHPLSAQESLTGAAILISAGFPAEGRDLMTRGFASGSTPRLDSRRDSLLLESLLAGDDPSIPVPPERPPVTTETARYTLRRAMLLEVRRDFKAAHQAYNQLQTASQLLTDSEKTLLNAGLRRVSSSHWPPPPGN